jgi:hypothetical protein
MARCDQWNVIELRARSIDSEQVVMEETAYSAASGKNRFEVKKKRMTEWPSFLFQVELDLRSCPGFND